MFFFKNKNFSSEQQYYAFISYRRDGLDKKWAKRIYKQLTNYNLNIYFKDIEDSIIEKEKINADDKTIKPIFKDTEQLTAGGELTDKIKHALENSRKIIVVCSRNMKEHEYWINMEVKYFISLGHGPEDVLPIIIESQIENSSPEKCFPTDLPINWHAISILDHKLTAEDGYIARLIMSIGDNKYRKTILSLIPNLFPTIKRSLGELWEMDKRQKITKWLLGVIFIVLFVGVLSVLSIMLYNARTRVYENMSMRLVDESQIECNNKNMQRAALLLQEIKKIKNKKFIDDFSPYAENYIMSGLNDFYNAVDTVNEYVSTPFILSLNNNENILAGFKPYNNIIYILNTKNLAVIDTIKTESNIEHISISNSGRYLFVLGVTDCCVIDIQNKKEVFKEYNISLGQGYRVNFSQFSSTIYPYSFSKDERFLYYLSGNFYSIDLFTGKKKEIPFSFNYTEPFLFTTIPKENNIIFVDSESAYIIDIDNNHVDSLTSVNGERIFKADLSNNLLFLIQKNDQYSSEDYKYDINIIDVYKDRIITHIEKSQKYLIKKNGQRELLDNFNICWMNDRLAIADSNTVSLYNLKKNCYSVISRASHGIMYDMHQIDKDKLMVWDKNGIHIYSITSKKKAEYIQLRAIDKDMPLFDNFFVNDNYLFHTSYKNGSKVYCRTIFDNKAGLKNLTGIAYNDTKKYIMLVYNFKHIKIIDAKNENIIKEFDSPIFVEGCPQVIKGRNEFVMRCQTDFVIYNPDNDNLWSLPKCNTYSTKYDKIDIKIDTYGASTLFYNNKNYVTSRKSILSYPLLIPDRNNCIEINNYKINILSRKYNIINGNKIEGSPYSYIENKNIYTFTNIITQDSFSIKLNYEDKGKQFSVSKFVFNDSDKLLFVVTGYHGSWKNYLFNYNGELLSKYDFVSPSVCSIKGGFLIGDLTKHGLFIIAPNKAPENVCKIDAFAGFLYTPDKKNIFLSGTSANNYLLSSKFNKDIQKLPILGTYYNIEKLNFSRNSRFLFIEDVLLRNKNNVYNCIIDLLENKILIYWPTQLFAPNAFTFFDDNTFFYADYNKDGTIRSYVYGNSNEDFFFDWIKEYSKREISLDELSEYGF